jgi:hypothetical protein
MDSKAKKRIEVLQTRLAKLKRQLAGATRQADDPQEAVRLRSEIETVEAEVRRLKEG